MKTPTVWKPQHYVHSPLAGIQGDASVVDIGTGRFVVVWTEGSDGTIGTSPGQDIIAQIYNARGEAVGAAFQVNQAFTAHGENQPDIAMRPGGGFVVVYREFPPSFVFSIRAETYDVNGNLVPGAATTISEEADDGNADSISNPSVAIRPTGDYLVAYNREYDSDDTTDVVGRMVDINGNVRGEFVIFDAGDTARNPDTAVLSNGNFVVVFEDADSAAMGADTDPEFRIVNPTGGFLAGGVIEPGPNAVADDVHVAALKGGGFVAVWEELNADTDQGIRARVYDNNGAPKGGAFLVNTSTFESQRQPEVAALPDGGFVVTWDDNGFSRTHGQRFDENGKKVGKEFVAGDLQSELSPFIGTLGDGRFVTGFEDFVAEDVLATIFDPRDEVIKGTRSADVITSRIDGAEVRGKKGKDILLGEEDKDLLRGGGGADVLAGDLGKDKLWGQGGSDKLVFDAALGGGNVDRLMDFKHNKDKLWLDMDDFAAIGPKLSGKEFRLGKKAGDGNDHLIVNADGQVFYDEDGKGGAKQVLFAKLDPKAKIDNGDFEMIEDLVL